MHSFLRAIFLNSNNGVKAGSVGRVRHGWAGLESLENRTFLSAVGADSVVRINTADAAIQVTKRAKTPMPRVASAAATNSSTVRVLFNRAVSPKDAAKLIFKVDALTIRSVNFPGGRVALLKTSPQAPGLLTVTATKAGGTGPATSFGAATFAAIPAPAPRVASAAALSNSAIRVLFNRVVSPKEAARLLFKVDGLTIRSVKFVGGRVAMLQTSPQQAGLLNVTATTDGSAGPALSLGAATFKAIPAPTARVASAAAVSSSAVRVLFTGAVSVKDAARLVFGIDGLTIRSVNFPGGRVALLQTSPQEAGVLSLTVMTDGSTGPAVSLGAVAFSAIPAPQVVSVVAIDENLIRVTYDRPMREAAVVASNYSISNDATGTPLAISSAAYAGSPNVVDLATAPQAYGTYSFTVNNVTDTIGQQVFFEGRKIVGNPKGAVVSAGATSSTTVVVSFNEPMADNALAPQHYVIKDSAGKVLPVTDARFDGPLGMVVNLTTAAQLNVLYQLTVSNITDLQNDGMDVRTASFQGIAGPHLAQAVSTDPVSIVLTFAGAVGDSALTPSAYKIEKLDAAGTSSAPCRSVRPLLSAASGRS